MSETINRNQINILHTITSALLLTILFIYQESAIWILVFDQKKAASDKKAALHTKMRYIKIILQSFLRKYFLIHQ